MHGDALYAHFVRQALARIWCALAVALVLARYFIGMLVGGTAVLWAAAWYYLRKPRSAHPWS